MLLFEERKGGRRSLTRVPQRSIVLKRKRGRYCFFATNRKARARVSFCLNVVPGKSVKVRKAVRFGEVKIVAQKGLVFLGDFGQVGVTGRWLKLPVGLHLLKVVQEDDPMVRKVLKVRVLRSQRALLRLK